MIARIEGWYERAAALYKEIHERVPEQYVRLRESMTGRGFRERLEALDEKDPVAYRWICVLNAVFDLDFELERLHDEVACRAARNGVVIHPPTPRLAEPTKAVATSEPAAD